MNDRPHCGTRRDYILPGLRAIPAVRLPARKQSASIRSKPDLRKNVANIAEFIRTLLKPDSCGDGFGFLSLALNDPRRRLSVPDKFPRCSLPDILHEMRAKRGEALSLREPGRRIQNAVAA